MQGTRCRYQKHSGVLTARKQSLLKLSWAFFLHLPEAKWSWQTVLCQTGALPWLQFAAFQWHNSFSTSPGSFLHNCRWQIKAKTNTKGVSKVPPQVARTSSVFLVTGWAWFKKVFTPSGGRCLTCQFKKASTAVGTGYEIFIAPMFGKWYHNTGFLNTKPFVHFLN